MPNGARRAFNSGTLAPPEPHTRLRRGKGEIWSRRNLLCRVRRAWRVRSMCGLAWTVREV
eukprot:scaffold271879_cov30-Tisochrysis_lutea.AAC.6